MSHSKPLFILGTTILSLILIAGTIDDVTTQFYAFAQEEEEEEEDNKEESKEEEEEEEEESSSKDEEAEESESQESSSNSNEETSSNNGERQKEEEEIPTETSVPNNTEIPTIIPSVPQEPIVNLTGDHILNPEPIITAVEEEEGVKKEFNATCKCMTTSAAVGEPTTTTKPTTTPTPQPQQPSNNQIPVTSANIVDSESQGQVTDGNYTGYYTVSNLLDNKIDDTSFWSQAGKSSFYIKLDNILDQYQVCSAELNVHKPTNSPYLLDVGVTKDYTGVIDQTTEKIQFDKCVKNMDEILMSFDNPEGSYISIAEIKLFGSKLETQQVSQPPQQTTIPPTLEQSPETENANKINIQDSKAEISIKNSTVTFKFDPMTATFVQQGTK